MATFSQEVVDAAERAYRDLGAISLITRFCYLRVLDGALEPVPGFRDYATLTKRPTWEALDKVQKTPFALMWFAGFLAGRAQSNGSKAPQISN